VEGRELFRDNVDVIVCDGFVGNIVLKQIEAMYRVFLKRGVKDPYLDRFNYENYGEPDPCIILQFLSDMGYRMHCHPEYDPDVETDS